MKIVASMNTRNELDRYLEETIAALLEWVDEIRVQDDGSDDGTPEYLESIGPEVVVRRNDGVRWTENEGALHQQLLDFTLEGEPTHVLAIDADEIVTDGPAVRRAIADAGRSTLFTFTLNMVEIWSREPMLARLDGGWRPHPVGILYRVPPAASIRHRHSWRIPGRKLAGGRVPQVVRAQHRRGRIIEIPVDILHLGWSNPLEREERHRRYVELDGGNFHASDHLDSILWPDEACTLAPYPLALVES